MHGTQNACDVIDGHILCTQNAQGLCVTQSIMRVQASDVVHLQHAVWIKWKRREKRKGHERRAAMDDAQMNLAKRSENGRSGQDRFGRTEIRSDGGEKNCEQGKSGRVPRRKGEINSGTVWEWAREWEPADNDDLANVAHTHTHIHTLNVFRVYLRHFPTLTGASHGDNSPIAKHFTNCRFPKTHNQSKTTNRFKSYCSIQPPPSNTQTLNRFRVRFVCSARFHYTRRTINCKRRRRLRHRSEGNRQSDGNTATTTTMTVAAALPYASLSVARVPVVVVGIDGTRPFYGFWVLAFRSERAYRLSHCVDPVAHSVFDLHE